MFGCPLNNQANARNILGVDSPFFYQPSLFPKPGCFPWVSGGFPEQEGSLGTEWTWKVPLPSCSVTPEKKGTLFEEDPFLVGQPQKKKGNIIGATEQLSLETRDPNPAFAPSRAPVERMACTICRFVALLVTRRKGTLAERKGSEYVCLCLIFDFVGGGWILFVCFLDVSWGEGG